METAQVELSWIEQRVAPKAKVVALCRPKSDSLWALGRAQRLLRTRTAVLHNDADAWHWAFAVNDRLDSIASLGDGSVLAVGEHLSALFDGECWSTMQSGLKGCRRIWGAHLASANALTEEGLFYFDGRDWARVDLKGAGIFGHWVDGDCDPGGAGWIVGTHGTHSCMAAGSATTWRVDRCGSWYLYLIYVGHGSSVFAAGGDGLWRHDGTHWTNMDDDRDLSRLPLALSAVGPSPIVIATTERNLQRPTPEIEVLTPDGWQTVRAPEPLDVSHQALIEVDGRGRLLFARGSRVWVSSRLT